MTVEPGLCRTWSYTQIVGFLMHRLIFCTVLQLYKCICTFSLMHFIFIFMLFFPFFFFFIKIFENVSNKTSKKDLSFVLTLGLKKNKCGSGYPTDPRILPPTLNFFSSPEPSGSQGELIVYPCSVVRPSVRRPSVVHHFQRSSSLKQLGQSKPNFT